MTLRIPGILILLTALSGAVSVAVAALPVVSRYAAADQVWTAATTPAPAAPNPRLDLAPILDFAPFGRAATPVTTDAAPSLLTLQGVSVSPDQNASRAIIAGGIGDSTSYRIGDQLSEGATLTEIASDHVTVTTANGPERLDFPHLASATATETSSDPTFSAKLQNLIPAAAPVAQSLTTLRDQLKLNPQALLDQYGITATAGGYQINDAALANFGVLAGDLITHINGQKVGDITADRGFLDEVAAAGAATLIAQRAGQPVTLQVTLP